MIKIRMVFTEFDYIHVGKLLPDFGNPFSPELRRRGARFPAEGGSWVTNTSPMGVPSGLYLIRRSRSDFNGALHLNSGGTDIIIRRS